MAPGTPARVSSVRPWPWSRGRRPHPGSTGGPPRWGVGHERDTLPGHSGAIGPGRQIEHVVGTAQVMRVMSCGGVRQLVSAAQCSTTSTSRPVRARARGLRPSRGATRSPWSSRTTIGATVCCGAGTADRKSGDSSSIRARPCTRNRRCSSREGRVARFRTADGQRGETLVVLDDTGRVFSQRGSLGPPVDGGGAVRRWRSGRSARYAENGTRSSGSATAGAGKIRWRRRPGGPPRRTS